MTNTTDALSSLVDQLHQEDCVTGMNRLPAGSVDLVFADPPFNIGYKYDVYDDSLETDEYLQWSEAWIRGVHHVLKADGAFWLAIGDEYAAELKVLSQRVGFHCRSWVIWYYTFGVHCKHKFTRSHAHLFHFVKDPKKFTFNADDPDVRVPSARQLVYNDKRANAKGRMPDDTWILRPQDLPSGFSADEDVWYFPRVAGTFKERAGFHGCQMPEHLLGRIVRACSNEGELVLDPFSGSATTAAVAKKLGRRYAAFEMSEEYVKLGNERLGRIEPGQPLNGSADPLRSVPSSSAGKKGFSAAAKRKATQSVGLQMSLGFEVDSAGENSTGENQAGDTFDEAILEAFQQSHSGFSVDRVLLDPVFSERLLEAASSLGVSLTPTQLRRRVLQLRFIGAFTAKSLQPTEATIIPESILDRYEFASEIAWRFMTDRYPGWTLDDLMSDANGIVQFDRIASQLAPNCDPFQLRWATIKLRDRASKLRNRATKPRKKPAKRKTANSPFGEIEPRDLHHIDLSVFEHRPAAVYRIESHDGKPLYIGETTDLKTRLTDHITPHASREFWTNLAEGSPRIRIDELPPKSTSKKRLKLWIDRLRQETESRCNCVDLWLDLA